MPTYLTSALNQFQTPSGAVGEPPDGPGAFQLLAAQIDTRLGIGGAENAANLAAIQAIPTARCFPGKLAYAADTGRVYRYTGSTNGWILWSAAWNYVPTWTNLTPGSSTVVARAQVTNGDFFQVFIALNGSTNFAMSGDVAVSLPAEFNGISALVGSGVYYPGGSLAGGASGAIPLSGNSSAGSTCTIRGIYAPTAGAATRQQTLSSVVTSTTSDQFRFAISGARTP